MSQATIDIVRGISQAAAHAYDGALDEKGEPIEIGLRREKGDPVLHSRAIDGFKIRIDGTKLIVTYQSEIRLKDVYAQDLEGELEQTMADIVSFLKKQYKKITGNALSLTPVGDCDALVQTTSRVRVFVIATKLYQIGGLDGTEDRLAPSEDTVEKNFKDFLAQGGLKDKKD
tara:strand:- start:1243 stop:1758 length:516 start_codon:yes stop_codon:yes gene_type:complete